MITQSQMDELNQSVVNIFQKIELELMIDIAQRLNTYESFGGSLEYHVKQLEQLNALNKDAIKTIAKYSGKTEKAIREMLYKAGYANIPDSDTSKLSTVIEDVIEKSIKEMNDEVRLIQTNAIQSANNMYMNILNKAYLETSVGLYSYDESIRRGVKEMAKNGLKVATYERKDGRKINYSIESVVRRDTLTACNQLANKVSVEHAEELGYDYMEVSSHMGARHDITNPINDHVHWQGKVYKIKGFDDKYGNFFTNTGYGELLGLGGVNCRHRAYPYKLGTPRASQEFNEVKSNELYEKEQKQRRMERSIRTTKKELLLAEKMGDNEQVLLLNKLLKGQLKAIKEYCNENNLRRDINREKIAEDFM